MQTWRDGRRNKRESCERQACHRITCKGYERKKCVHGGKERFKKQYSPANIDVWIRDLVMEYSPVIKGLRLDKIALFCFSTEFNRKLGLLVSIKTLS